MNVTFQDAWDACNWKWNLCNEREGVKETRQFSSLLGRLKGPLIRAKLNITSCLEGLVSDREVTRYLPPEVLGQFFGPSRPVLGVFWAPLSQITSAPLYF